MEKWAFFISSIVWIAGKSPQGKKKFKPTTSFTHPPLFQKKTPTKNKTKKTIKKPAGERTPCLKWMEFCNLRVFLLKNKDQYCSSSGLSETLCQCSLLSGSSFDCFVSLFHCNSLLHCYYTPALNCTWQLLFLPVWYGERYLQVFLKSALNWSMGKHFSAMEFRCKTRT